jgi:hypothetical protein
MKRCTRCGATKHSVINLLSVASNILDTETVLFFPGRSFDFAVRNMQRAQSRTTHYNCHCNTTDPRVRHVDFLETRPQFLPLGMRGIILRGRYHVRPHTPEFPAGPRPRPFNKRIYPPEICPKLVSERRVEKGRHMPTNFVWRLVAASTGVHQNYHDNTRKLSILPATVLFNLRLTIKIRSSYAFNVALNSS